VSSDRVEVRPVHGVELARLVSTRPDLVRARRVFAECYTRLTDEATPRAVVAELEPIIEALEDILDARLPYLMPHFSTRPALEVVA
jgi:hypothetical protein